MVVCGVSVVGAAETKRGAMERIVPREKIILSRRAELKGASKLLMMDRGDDVSPVSGRRHFVEEGLTLEIGKDVAEPFFEDVHKLPGHRTWWPV